MKIDVKSLVDILRYPMLNDMAKGVLEKNGFVPAYKQKTLHEGLTAYLIQADKGIELAFSERDGFESDFAPAKADGDAIFTGIFIYPNGTEDYEKFDSAIGFGIDNCKTRSDALSRLGKPEMTGEDDCVFEWDRWKIEEYLAIFADYDKDQNVSKWTICVPMPL